MPRDVARAGLYRGSINLWVEDGLSREYLSTLWNDPGVAFFVGGGNEGVRAIVKDAEDAKFPTDLTALLAAFKYRIARVTAST